MKAQVKKQFKNGNMIVSITREVTTEYHVFFNGWSLTEKEIEQGEFSVQESKTIDKLNDDNLFSTIELIDAIRK